MSCCTSSGVLQQGLLCQDCFADSPDATSIHVGGVTKAGSGITKAGSGMPTSKQLSLEDFLQMGVQHGGDYFQLAGGLDACQCGSVKDVTYKVSFTNPTTCAV